MSLTVLVAVFHVTCYVLPYCLLCFSKAMLHDATVLTVGYAFGHVGGHGGAHLEWLTHLMYRMHCLLRRCKS